MQFVSIETNHTIASVLDNINLNQRGGIFLPYIQRDFVWDETRIYSLLDSLMRGYPTGTILMWETDKPFNYRKFEQNFNPDNIEYDFLVDDDSHKTLKRYVLDGQQRLQSLYIAIHGTYDAKILFFNLLSDANSEIGYEFKFMDENSEPEYWLNVPKFISRHSAPSFDTIQELTAQKVIPPIISDADKDKILNNARALYDIFKNFHNIPLQTLTNDMELKDIAEIFIRTNSGGIVLDATDLVMATITSEWTDANEEFNKLAAMIKYMGFKKPRTFILQACFAILLGTPGMTAIARRNFKESAIQDKLKQNFKEISAAINDVLKFVNDISEAIAFTIPFYNPVLILIAYRYAAGQNKWHDKLADAKAFFFTAFLCGEFTRPTQKLMKKLLEYVSDKQKDFSMNEIKRIFKENGDKTFSVNDDELLKMRINAPLSNLIMYLVYSGQEGFDVKDINKLVHDHIFPKSKLKELKQGRKQLYTQDQYDSIINCELLTSAENQAKGASLPKDYFTPTGFSGADKLQNFLKLHAIPEQFGEDKIDLWDLGNYEKFLEARKKLMKERIKKNLKNLVSTRAPKPPVTIVTRFKNLLKKVLASK